ncbi:MAG TPA: TM0106 family RecB-like putative nuclease, partial [Gemmatimonadaceae bacterium]|nr:TM0106 family RecB-like putative nuclease [Gemmatimonadaceae bacterium]
MLQLAVYTEVLGALQGAPPSHFHVVTPGAGGAPPVRHSYRTDEYAAYFRMIRDQLLATAELPHQTIAERYYPEPVEHCDVCPWWRDCADRRRADDHLSLVANVPRLHRHELEAQGVTTLTGLASLPVPLTFRPRRGAVQTYEQAREQALVQLQSRGQVRPLYRFRPVVEKEGFCRLPAPSPGDIFLDLEGDPLAVDGGREYLFGLVTVAPDGTTAYRGWWALTARAEREGFEQVMDVIMDAWARHEGMHVYHYSPYEPAAFKRLMGRHATRGEELDRLLRGERFVDLYGVVRQGLYAGVERYSIKNLEALYGFTRDVDLASANVGRAELERALELGRADLVPREVHDTVEGYNRDDCVSTLRLRDWLERLRGELAAAGAAVPRPVAKEDEASKELAERQQRVDALRDRLLADIPEARADRDDGQEACFLLAHMLDFHRREDKATWWEYYRLRDLPEDELPDEPQAIADLEFVDRVDVVRYRSGKPTGTVVDRYSYPAQEMEIRRGADLKVKDGPFGELVALDRNARTIDVRKGKKRAGEHPTSVFAHDYVHSKPIEDALFRLGERVAERGAAALDRVAAGDLLLARPPRLRSAAFESNPGESMTAFAVRIADDLDQTVLAIQGPPGSGKTYTGARMICALVRAGKRVGVTANSHKVIRNLLDAVHSAAAEMGTTVRLAHKHANDEDDDDEGSVTGEAVREVAGNEEALDLLQQREVDVLGGTAWLWSREDAGRAVDVLFVDEAGQMSLANTVAVSQAAASVVLLGDPRQLEQPRKGTHPDGVGSSALQHLLRGRDTVPADRGIFLPVTYRLPPSICEFTSELFYEKRLESRPGLERQVLAGTGDFHGSGLWVVEVEHDGNRSASPEDVEVVAGLVRQLTRDGARWVGQDGRERPLTGDDILVVAPYNAQVSRLEEALAGT